MHGAHTHTPCQEKVDIDQGSRYNCNQFRWAAGNLPEADPLERRAGKQAKAPPEKYLPTLAPPSASPRFALV